MLLTIITDAVSVIIVKVFNTAAGKGGADFNYPFISQSVK